jgi:hypothetical protein
VAVLPDARRRSVASRLPRGHGECHFAVFSSRLFRQRSSSRSGSGVLHCSGSGVLQRGVAAVYRERNRSSICQFVNLHCYGEALRRCESALTRVPLFIAPTLHSTKAVGCVVDQPNSPAAVRGFVQRQPSDAAFCHTSTSYRLPACSGCRETRRRHQMHSTSC